MSLNVISFMVENKPGVLARVVDLISGRGYNIDSLNVAPTLDPTASRMTIQVPGDDRVHFKRLNAETYCQDEAQDRTLPGVCPCDGGVAPELDAGDVDADVNTQPMWFNYQTVSSKHVGYGGFYLFEITLDDMEQDFSIPGPYGH